VSRCPQCRHENPSDAKFCLECGRRLALSCPACSTDLPAGAKFCKECGRVVSAAPPARVGDTPESYTPRHLAEKILTSKSALEGERKQVTVLFADLKGSMELLADRDPEEARKLLDPILERMMEAVHRYEGTVNQVMGDGIMALFGAPLAHEDHAVRACYAALRMQESIKRYAEEVHRSAGVPLHIRIGANSGEVVVRSIGSDLHMDYTAVGQTTHLAARLEQMATPGAIFISPETFKLTEGYVVAKALGHRPIKGWETPIQVFELVGAGTVRSRLQAAATQGLTRFVGRQPELEQLWHAFELAGAGSGQVVTVVGEPGVGKSRLFWEFTHSPRTQGWLVLESHSVSYGKATAFLPLAALLRVYFQIEEAHDETRTVREKVRDRLFALDRALEPCLPALLWLLDVPVDDPHWQPLDPSQRRQQMLDGVKRLLLRESQVQPLLLVFEDVHWVDADTQAFLDSLVTSLPRFRVLLLLNHRPEYSHGWGRQTYCRQLRVDPLRSEGADSLLDALLGSDPSLAPLKALVIERTDGNPFFIEETVRSLRETGVLAGERGAYHLTSIIRNLQIPATVHAILAARIDRLSLEDKHLLQAGAVIGMDVPFELLQALADEPEDRLRRGLADLQATEFLYETRLFPSQEYTFRHALTHEVAYGSLVRDRRRVLHRRLVDVIEEVYADSALTHIEQLARHAMGGELWDRAIAYLQHAARRAAARSASHEARSHLEQALAALTHLTPVRDVKALAVDVRLDMQEALQPLGDLEQMLTYLKEAEAMAKALGDQLRLGRVSSHMAYCLWWRGELDKAMESGHRAVRIGAARQELTVQVTGSLRLGMAYFFAGALREALDLFQQNVELVGGERARERFGLPFLPAVFARVYRSWGLTCLGEFGIARDNAEEAVRIAEAVDHPFTKVWAHVEIGVINLEQGRFPAAISALEWSRQLWKDGGWAFMFPWVAGPLGRVYTATGQVAEALLLLERSVDVCTTMKVIPLLTLSLTYLSEAYLVAGRQHDAREMVRRALDMCRSHRQRLFEPDVLRIEGRIRACEAAGDGDGDDAAQGSYTDALALAGDLGMRPLVAHCHLGLGKLCRRAGNRPQAHEHLTAAATMYREMDMRFWLEQTEAEMRRLA
jgi:class 3 adenylate cyclase/tetratricopeptide (TPR) repeat protein